MTDDAAKREAFKKEGLYHVFSVNQMLEEKVDRNKFERLQKLEAFDKSAAREKERQYAELTATRHRELFMYNQKNIAFEVEMSHNKALIRIEAERAKKREVLFLKSEELELNVTHAESTLALSLAVRDAAKKLAAYNEAAEREKAKSRAEYKQGCTQKQSTCTHRIEYMYSALELAAEQERAASNAAATATAVAAAATAAKEEERRAVRKAYLARYGKELLSPSA